MNINDKCSYEGWLAILSHIHKLQGSYLSVALHRCCRCLEHFTAEASPCIDIRSHQAKPSTKLLNESIYSTHVSIFIIFVIQCVNNSMYCDFIYFLYCIHHRNCTFPCSACRHRSQITDPRSSLQQQGIETKKASKTESCGKSSEEHCGVRTNKKNWNFQKYVFGINIYIYKHWVGKQSEPRPLLQRRPANPGGYRISQNLTESQWKKWIENVEPRPGVTWLNSSDHPTSQVPGPGSWNISNIPCQHKMTQIDSASFIARHGS